MYIQKKQYLSFLQQIEFLKQQNLYLKKDNSILADQLIKERQSRIHLHKVQQQNTLLIQKLNEKTLNHQNQNTLSITNKIVQIGKQTKQFIQNKFDNLEKISLFDIKKLEIKNIKTQLNYFQLHDFVEKIKKIYLQSQTNQQIKLKKSPTLTELIKWIKCLPGLSIPNHKSLLDTSSSVGNLKKQSNKQLKKKQKQIESFINKVSESKYLSFADYSKENLSVKN